MLHTLTIIAKLEDSDGSVRKAAVEILGKLSPAELATHARGGAVADESVGAEAKSAQ